VIVLELSRQLSQLQQLIEKSGSFSSEDFELQSHWARYICVLAAGFLENALHELYLSYSSSRAHPNVARFVSKSLDSIQNPRSDIFLRVANNFDENWKNTLEAFIDDNGRKEAINSIIGNRHLIAHGKISNISLAQIKAYIAKSVEVMDFIEAQCGIRPTR
jgi:hypothetical protein